MRLRLVAARGARAAGRVSRSGKTLIGRLEVDVVTGWVEEGVGEFAEVMERRL